MTNASGALPKLRLGTRGSALALWQANWTKSELEKRWPGLRVELDTDQDHGRQDSRRAAGEDRRQRTLHQRNRRSAARRPNRSRRAQPQRCSVSASRRHRFRRDPPNAKIRAMHSSPTVQNCRNCLPARAIGTSSLRRQVQLRHRFPALNLVMLRGNVDTRLRKLRRRRVRRDHPGCRRTQKAGTRATDHSNTGRRHHGLRGRPGRPGHRVPVR